jgi:ATP-binding cassette subfamily C protein LapB
MDQTTERLLRDRLRKVCKDRTLIIATHRSSLLDLVDDIMVIESGQLAAYGPKAEVSKQLNQAAAKGADKGANQGTNAGESK